MTWVQAVEIVAVIFGLASVILTVRRHIWCWPAGLIMVTLYIIIYREARLYSDLLLQVIYIPLQIYGWRHWLHGGRERDELPVTRLSPAGLAQWIAIAALGTAGLGFIMGTFTDADVPYWDAATTVISLAAQWLMAKKLLDSWYFWISVDVLYLGVYNFKGLYPTMGMYACFLLLAVSGFWEWKKTLDAPGPA